MSSPSAASGDVEAGPQGGTLRKLQQALHRLQRGTPRRVKKGTRITPASVAREADVDRSTLYRFHQNFLEEIRAVTNKQLTTRLKERQATTSALQRSVKDHVRLTEQAQANVVKQARIIHRQEQRIKELEELLRSRDEAIVKYQRRVNSA